MTIKLQQLLVACQEGHVKRVGEILDTGEVGVNAADELEITAIQVAAANNQDQVGSHLKGGSTTNKSILIVSYCGVIV